MRAIVWGAVGLVVGYALGGLLAYTIVHLLSRNVHDKDLEALSTAFFFAGPLLGLLGGVAGLLLGLRKPG